MLAQARQGPAGTSQGHPPSLMLLPGGAVVQVDQALPGADGLLGLYLSQQQAQQLPQQAQQQLQEQAQQQLQQRVQHQEQQQQQLALLQQQQVLTYLAQQQQQQQHRQQLCDSVVFLGSSSGVGAQGMLAAAGAGAPVGTVGITAEQLLQLQQQQQQQQQALMALNQSQR